MIRLLYDLTASQPSPESKFHGGGVYAEVVFFKLLEKVKEKRIHLFAFYDASLYINEDILNAIKEYAIPLFDITETNVTRIVAEQKIDRIYSAMLNLNQDIPLGKVQVYTTVHGLRTLEMPFDPIMLYYATSLKEKIKYRLFMGPARWYYLKKLRVINGRLVTDERIQPITISRHSAASIQAFFPETAKRTIPVFAGLALAQLPNYAMVQKNSQTTVQASLQSIGVKEKQFFLITSAARWAKNALRAVWALDNLFEMERARGFKAVVTGVTNKKIFLRGIKHTEQFVFLDYVDRDMLQILTKYQYAFIYPSLNEGFGIPPLESMEYGVPVVASGTSSIPEVCGDAAIYFDPYSVSEIKNRLVQILNPEIYAEYAKKATERFRIVSSMQKSDLEKLTEFIIS